MGFAQLPQQLHAVPVGQLQVEQDEREVGVLCDRLGGLAGAGDLQDDGFGAQLPEHAAHRLADEGMVVNHQEFHVRTSGVAQTSPAAGGP